MALPQGDITVGAVQLDNGSWRRVCAQNVITETRDNENQTIFLFREFTIIGSTPTELMDRWTTTLTDFSKRDTIITATVDDASGSYLAVLTAFNGTNQGNSCGVEILDDYVQTANSLRCLFKAQAIRPLASGTEDTGLDGQIGKIEWAKVYNAGRVEARSATGRFKTTAQYDTARATILSTYLGTGVGGQRDSSTGLALTQESISLAGTGGDTTDFILASEWMPVALSNSNAQTAGRRLEMMFTSSQPASWDGAAEAGPIPTMVTARGSVTVSKDELAGASLRTWWDRIRPDIISEAKRQTNRSTLELIDQAMTFGPNGTEITFQLTLQTGGPLVFAYHQVKEFASDQPVTIWRAGAERYAQRPEGFADMSISYSISRVGQDKVDLEPVAPTDFGLTWVVRPFTTKERLIVTPSGHALYEQSAAVTFIPFSANAAITEISPKVRQ